MACEKTNSPCISIIGMAGAGKSTVGAILARRLGWAFMDTDNVIEALYGARLQDITDLLGKDAFLDAECLMIRSIRASRCVLATGGSVIYRPEAIAHLGSLGPIVWLKAPFARIEERVARNPQRGLAIRPGQSLADLYAERRPLYEKAAGLVCETGEKNQDECAEWIFRNLPPVRQRVGAPHD